jgi:hypothetical protein
MNKEPRDQVSDFERASKTGRVGEVVNMITQSKLGLWYNIHQLGVAFYALGSLTEAEIDSIENYGPLSRRALDQSTQFKGRKLTSEPRIM